MVLATLVAPVFTPEPMAVTVTVALLKKPVGAILLPPPAVIWAFCARASRIAKRSARYESSGKPKSWAHSAETLISLLLNF